MIRENEKDVAKHYSGTQGVVLYSRICFVFLLIGSTAPLCSATLTGSLSPSNPTVGVTNASIVGTASPNATVTETIQTSPDGTTQGPFSTTANSSGNYSLGPFMLQELGTYQGTLRDSISGQTINITYSGAGNFNASVNTTSQTVTRGSAASYTVTVSSVSGFAGTVNLAALNFSTIPGATGSWSASSVAVPSNGSAQATFTIQTSSTTTPATYSNIQFRETNGSLSATLTVSLTVNGPAATLTGSLSPSNPTVGVTNASIVGTASPNATVTETIQTSPDGTTQGPFSTTANSSGNYSLGPFMLQELGTYQGTLRDSISGQTINITYSGAGNFNASVNTTSQTVTRGSAASYTVTVSSVSGFAGTVNLAALNFSTIPGATGSWSASSVAVPSNGSAQATFTIQTSSTTTPATYSNIQFRETNGSLSATLTVSLTVNGPAATLTGSLSPSNPTVGVTNASIVGTASPNATVTETIQTSPDGTTQGPFSTTANSSGNYSLGPFMLQELGTYQGTLRDSISGQTINITYSGAGNFNASVNTTSQTVTRGSAASYTVTVSSVSGFAGTVNLAALNFSTIPGATGSWSASSVAVPSNGSAQATFTIQTSSTTTPATYSNIQFRETNGSLSATLTVSLTVNGPAATLTGSLSPSNPTVGVTNASIVGTASPNATVTETIQTSPDGTTQGPFSTTANSSGNYSLGPFMLQELGTYQGTLRDSISGQTINITYSGAGNFNASVNTTSQSVSKGSSASFTVTFSSVSGFAGTVIPAALNWSQIPGATASWSPQSVSVPANSSATATFTIQTSSTTTAGTYGSITLQGANGSVTNAASQVSLTVNAAAVTLTGSLSPSSPTVGVTNASIVGTASPNATVTETIQTSPDGTTQGPFSTTANSSGNYSLGPFMLQELGTYQGTLKDSTSGQVINITYRGAGNFNASVNTTSQTVTRGSAASYLVTVSSVSGFAGAVNLAALNFSAIPGATGTWSSSSVTVPSNGSAQATFTLQTSSTTTAATYSNLTLQGTNGSVTNAASPVSLTVGGGGSDAATLVSETIPDNTQEAAGASYTKTWTIGNSGTTTWGSSYSLQYVSGNAGCNHATLPLGVTIPPNSNMIWSTSCTAPSTAGTYREDWKLVGPSGTIPVSGSSTVWVQVVVAGGGSVTITSISPSSPVATTQNQNVTVLGSGFQANLTVDLISNATTVGHLAGSQIQQVTSSSFVMSINFNGNAGAYAIRVNSPNGGPSSAPYSFNVVSPSKPQLTISQTSVSFQSIAGQIAPPSQNVIVSSVGGAIPFSASLAYGGTAKWLTMSPTTSTTPTTVSLTVASGLAAGNYTATLTIASTSDSTQTAQVQATLAVAEGNLKLGTITMVDPVPSLLSGPGVTSDPTVLSAGGTPVQGVAADGVAQIVLKIPSSRLGESFTLNLYNDVGGHSISSDLDGGLLTPGGSFLNPSSSLTVTSVQTVGQYQAFAVYRAPIDFARPGTNDATGTNRSVTVIVQSSDGPSGPLKIDIERPPVLLVHGIWSGPTTWDYFCPGKQTGDECADGPLSGLFTISRADYESTNGGKFADNATIVFRQEEQDLILYRSAKNIAAAQWDVVAHSMGGNIIRTIAASSTSQHNANYNAGEFHKLITIDTPHLGSEFAARLEASNTVACQTVLFDLIAGLSVGGAVEDLSPGSAALMQQSSSILTHTIGATATTQQTSVVENKWTAAGASVLCPSILPISGGFATVFSGAGNDLIVSISSQLATRAVGSSVAIGTCQDTSLTSTICAGNLHTVNEKLFIDGPDVLARTVSTSVFSTPLTPLNSVIGASSPIPQKVIDLLNSWITGGQFDVFH